MADNTKDQPGRVQPNESENQPGYEPEKEQSRRAARRDRQDEVSGPPPGGIDPDRGASGEEQVEDEVEGQTPRKNTSGSDDERDPRDA